jgi:hypothetical protein
MLHHLSIGTLENASVRSQLLTLTHIVYNGLEDILGALD